jgi:hypothetical protein
LVVGRGDDVVDDGRAHDLDHDCAGYDQPRAAADIHLDSPLRGLGAHQGFPSERLRGATRAAFSALVDLALNERADAVVIGSTSPLPDGRVEVRFLLMDVAKQSQLAGFSYTVNPGQLRLTAHRISDAIYERLTGVVGVFSLFDRRLGLGPWS